MVSSSQLIDRSYLGYCVEKDFEAISRFSRKMCPNKLESYNPWEYLVRQDGGLEGCSLM